MYKRETLTPASEAEWLAMRADDLTSTEIAALFDCSPYLTEFELYHVKVGRLESSFKENDRTVWGRRLEASIAAGVAEDYGVIAAPFKTYMRMPEFNLGASFDFKIVGLVDGFTGDQTLRDLFRQHGEGVLEIKNVDGLAFKRGWLTDGEIVEAPPHIELQIQHQMEVSDLNWCAAAALVGGNRPVIITRQRDAEIGAIIRTKAQNFWRMVGAGVAPAPNFAKDGDTIGRLYVDNDGSTEDMSDNERLAELCAKYKAAGAEEKAFKEMKDAYRAEILTIIRAHKKVTANGFILSAGTNKATIKSYRRAESERVTITISRIPEAEINASTPAYRNVRITEAA